MSILILRIVSNGPSHITEENWIIQELKMLPKLGNLFQQTIAKTRLTMFMISIQILIQMLKRLLRAQSTVRTGMATIILINTPVNLTMKENISADKVLEDMAAMEDMAATEAMGGINPTEVQVAKIIVMEAIPEDMAMVVMEDIALTTMMEIKLQLLESRNKSMTGGITSEKIS